ncbi:MAG TPA: hypothetical protein VI935_09785 [Thermodesulfobacteriota bacterium]|nr:hypothetical protein [Thermodesulfobacteriota bacterium]
MVLRFVYEPKWIIRNYHPVYTSVNRRMDGQYRFFETAIKDNASNVTVSERSGGG